MFLDRIFTSLCRRCLNTFNWLTQVRVDRFLINSVPVADIVTDKKPFNFPRFSSITQISNFMASYKSYFLVCKWMWRIYFCQGWCVFKTICKLFNCGHFLFVANNNNCQLWKVLLWENRRCCAGKCLFFGSLLWNNARIIPDKHFV